MTKQVCTGRSIYAQAHACVVLHNTLLFGKKESQISFIVV